MKAKVLLAAVVALPIGYWAYISGDSPNVAQAQPTSQPSPARERQAYFGDLHNHTALSFDAYIRGARANLDEVYRFARGDTVSFMGEQLRRNEPLDFIAVTDHAEQMGFGDAMEDSNSALGKSSIGQRVKAGDRSIPFMMELKDLNVPEVKAFGSSAWKKSKQAANKYYRPGKFTTFLGYEWTAMPKDFNLHRNVIFRGNDAPFPFTAQDSQRPEDLWTYLEQNRRRGFEALAIPHNANDSNGLMYDWVDSDGRPVNEVYAQRRLLNEPLSEIVQTKGQSETHPTLSLEDEFVDFEVFDFSHRLTAKRKEHGTSALHGNFIRDAYGRGLEIAKTTGVNPYKFGMAGGTDLHSGFSTSAEAAYSGNVFAPPKPIGQDEAQSNLGFGDQSKTPRNARTFGSGALTGVWAEANTRESIYTALRRKETFATSGTRLRVRMFAGWNYPRNLLARRDWVQTAYARGVPMGGDLPVQPRGARAPAFLIWALKDPNGANLDRAQIVKVWLDGQNRREKIYDVALSGNRRIDPATGKAPPVGNTVDLQTATYTNSIGSTQFARMWTDPDFDPARPAVYYLRVLEIPTPRWTTHLAVRHGLPLPKDSPPTLQERAWSSPIWYTPTMRTRV